MASEIGAPGETRTHAPGFGGRCSIQLSYEGRRLILVQNGHFNLTEQLEKGSFVNTCNHRSVYMLNEIASRKQKLGLSTRRLAQQLEVSPALLSLVLNEKRAISGDLKGRIRRWLNTPMANGGYNHPNTVYKEFMAERASFVSTETLRYYREKLEPFILWCEKRDLADITQMDRGTIGEFLAYVRKGRRKYGNSTLSNGAIKLHHQTLKTLFNYTGQTRSVPSEWSNPVKAIKVKRGDATRVEYSDHELSSVMEIIGRNRDQVLRLRNLAIVTVLLNSALRASELLSMQTSDVSENGRLTVNGKGGKRRTVTIGQSGVDAVNVYLNSRTTGKAICGRPVPAPF